MYPYTPRLSHAALTTLGLVVCIILSGKTDGRTSTAWNIGALVCAIMTAVVLGLLIAREWQNNIAVMIDFMDHLARLDEEGRAMLAWQFPAMKYRMKRGEVRAYFEDTDVPIETFRLFLQTSNSKYISPRREWYTRDKPEWAWNEIRDWLEANGKIYPDSAAGSHSWLWQGNSYDHLTAYWMAGRKIVEMGEERVFAYDIPTSPPEEDARGG